MVHALREDHRVLKPGGVLIDLRPAAEHRRVGIAHEGHIHAIARLNEVLEDDRAANRAVQRVVDGSLFRREKRYKFLVNRYADTFADFNAWLNEFSQLKPCHPAP